MKYKKSAFTLAEIMITITIIAVVLAISVPALKTTRALYKTLGYFTQINVKNIVSNVLNGYSDNELLMKNDSERQNYLDYGQGTRLCRISSGQIVNALITDNGKYSQEEGDNYESCAIQPTEVQDNKFCRLLTKDLNLIGEPNCNLLFTVILKDNVPNINITNDNIDNPTFILSNGMKYYLSLRYVDEENVSSNFGYRIMAVDLNGKNRPNKMSDDIVQFLILDNGEVYPIGIAADSRDYINTRVQAYYYDKKGTAENSDLVPAECKKGSDGIYTNDINKWVCNYIVDYIETSDGTSHFPYRQAYCLAAPQTPEYRNYCNGISRSPFCPGLNVDSQDEDIADVCEVLPIKPVFRFGI